MVNFSLIKENLNIILNKTKYKSAGLLAFVGNPQVQQGAILFSMSIVLAMLVTPQTHFKYPEYKVGSIATSNIKADRDFMVEKKSATARKKMEAINDIPSVYDYDSDAASPILANLTNAFSTMKEPGRFNESANSNLESSAAPKQIKKDFEKAIGITLTADEFNTLYKNKFSSNLLASIKKLVTAAYSAGIITNVTFLQQEKDKGIIVRDVKSQSEKEFKDLSKIRHIKDVEVSLNNMSDKTAAADVRKTSLSLALKLIQPNLTSNKNATELRRQDASKDVNPVLFKVQKNEMLVREGEKITSEDMDKLDAYYMMKGEKRLSSFLVFLGTFFIVGFLGLILFYSANNWLKMDISDLLFLSVAAILQIAIVKAGIFIAEAATDAFPLLPTEAFIYPIPFAVSAMLASLLINRNLALILSVFLSVIITFLFDGKVSLFLFSFLGSVIASYRIADCKQRSAFFKVGFVLGMVNIAAIIFLKLVNGNIFSFETLLSLLMGFSGGVVSGILVAGLTPLFETLFHYTTDIKLLELANLNQPIFQRMIIEAPGTYHHSIIVASMVETAAEAIKANSLLAKVSAYYHDIGKMKKPHYFIENQQNGENKHDKLTPKMSSLVIISHVKEGCDMASKEKLGPEIINIIREHHGTGLVSFFYGKAKKDKDPSIRSLPESNFRYPGPKPQTKEAGLVLLGDVVEASSRTLSNPTPSRIKTLVRERIERIFTDGQLDESELTFHDLYKIADSFIMILNGIFHHRIDYPEPASRESNGYRKENNDSSDRKQAEKDKGRSASSAAGGK